eukprot:m.12886 g.12886  ORF g.12886 m.12886 type:complete len:61 (-) comp4075_c0_seq1:1725-1907(-)
MFMIGTKMMFMFQIALRNKFEFGIKGKVKKKLISRSSDVGYWKTGIPNFLVWYVLLFFHV